MELIFEIREWTMWVMEAGILYYVAREFYYDKDKDERKQRKTKTTKRTTTEPSGLVVIEEDTETTESKGNK